MTRGFFALAALLVASVLAGCGFTPLYAENGVVPGLSRIEVIAPDGRTAYLLRERLDDSLGRNGGAPPAYRLDYELREDRIPRGLGPDNAASRYELNISVDWRLTNLATSAELKRGLTDVIVTYGAADAPYAGIAAQQNGQERAAAEAARRIRLELAQYFATQAR